MDEWTQVFQAKYDWLFDWLINFNGMSTCQDLLYA